ncbi:MAG: GAF domain-containing protein, partial [Pyrinomonadaceae bacterium]
MSKELENSLFESIQNYLDERLRSIDEQLAKLQSDFNEAVTHAREAAASSPVTDTPLSAAISAHLQTAREQKLSGATGVPAGPADLSGLRRGIDELKDQRTQSDVLSTLLRNAAQFADRAVLFVIKGDQAIAWRMSESRDPGNLQTVSGVAVPLAGNTVVSQAARSRSAETASGTRSEDSVLVEQLRGDAQQLAALPLTVRGKVVAVLYLDSAWPHQDAIRLDALEVLTQVAGMAVELASPRVARPAQASSSAVEAAVQPAAPAPAAPADTAPAEP